MKENVIFKLLLFLLSLLITESSLIAIIPTAIVAGSAILIETYIRIPQKILFGSDPIPIPFDPIENKTEYFFILFPGFGGPDVNTDRVIKNIKKSDSDNFNRFVYCYDWKKWCGNLFRAAFDSQRIGRVIGKQLANLPQNVDIHIAGISVGAFAADECINEFNRVRNKTNYNNLYKSKSRLTLLDPFTSRGVFGNNYGIKNFGKNADYCEHFLNTDDPVPSTNSPVTNAHVYDITKCKQRDSFTPLKGDSMHSWPVAFYGLNWLNKIDPNKKRSYEINSINKNLFKPSHNDNPRGKITKIP